MLSMPYVQSHSSCWHCYRGSYGVVRRVIDKNSGNQYAAKFLRYNDVFIKEELMQELEMMALLDHNNIVQIVDGYEDKKRLAIVMEMYPCLFVLLLLLLLLLLYRTVEVVVMFLI